MRTEDREKAMDEEKIIQAIKIILEAIGEEPNRGDLVDTPKRVAQVYKDIFSGIHKDPKKELEVLLDEDHDEIVLLKDIPFYSICEHHLLPFIGKVHVAYIPKNKRVTGLSKLVKVIDILSRRLQVQERLTTDISNCLMDKLKPMGVLVIIEADHLCMSMRGVKKSGITTVTSAVRGIFKSNEKTRQEVLSLINAK